MTVQHTVADKVASVKARNNASDGDVFVARCACSMWVFLFSVLHLHELDLSRGKPSIGTVATKVVRSLVVSDSY